MDCRGEKRLPGSRRGRAYGASDGPEFDIDAAINEVLLGANTSEDVVFPNIGPPEDNENGDSVYAYFGVSVYAYFGVIQD